MALRGTPLKRLRGNVVGQAVSIFGVLIFVYPIVWILVASIKPQIQVYREPLSLIPAPADFSGFNIIFQQWPFWTFMLNSLLYSVGAVVIALGFALFAAFGLSRDEFRGKQTTLVLILVVQMIPAIVSVIPIYLLMQQLGLYNSRFGMVFLYSAMRIPWAVWILVGFVNKIPRQLDESAIIDGCSRLGVLRRIILPLALPGLASAAIFTFVGTWNEFAIASILLRDTEVLSLPVAALTIIQRDPTDWRLIAVIATVNLLPIIAVFAVLQRQIVAGLTRGAVKG